MQSSTSSVVRSPSCTCIHDADPNRQCRKHDADPNKQCRKHDSFHGRTHKSKVQERCIRDCDHAYLGAFKQESYSGCGTAQSTIDHSGYRSCLAYQFLQFFATDVPFLLPSLQWTPFKHCHPEQTVVRTFLSTICSMTITAQPDIALPFHL